MLRKKAFKKQQQGAQVSQQLKHEKMGVGLMTGGNRVSLESSAQMI